MNKNNIKLLDRIKFKLNELKCTKENNEIIKDIGELVDSFFKNSKDLEVLRTEINVVKDILLLDSSISLEEYITRLYNKIDELLNLDLFYLIKKDTRGHNEVILISKFLITEEDKKEIKKYILKREDVENVRFLTLKIGDINKSLDLSVLKNRIHQVNVKYYDYLNEIGVMYDLKNQDRDVSELLEMVISILHHKLSIEEISNLEEKLRKDSMTNLYNKKTFEDTLTELSQSAIYKNNKFCLIMVDLNDFKNVNDRYGHSIGDDMIKKTAEILTESFRNDDLIARLGGDEFGVILKNIDLTKGVELAKRFIDNVKSERIETSLNILKIKLAIGIVEFPTHAQTKDEIKNVVDHAMYVSKSKGDYYLEIGDYGDQKLDLVNIEDNSIIELMEDALEERNGRKIEPIYHNSYSTLTHDLLSKEVFISINDNGNIIRASAFIDQASRNGLINDLQIGLLKRVLKDTQEDNVPLSFNIAVKDLYNLKSDFLDNLFQIYRLKPFLLEFNENDFFSKRILFFDRNQELSENLNYKIIIDDFGINNSNYMYLNKLDNIDSIKVNLKYLKSELGNPQDVVNYIKSLMIFTDSLEIKVIIKFVETKDDYLLLKQINSHNLYFQGFFADSLDHTLL